MQPTARQRRAEWFRIALILACGAGSGWLYAIVVRVAPRLTSAEPTAISEVFHRVWPLTHEGLQSIQHHTHGFGFTGQYAAACAGLWLLYGLIVWAARGLQGARRTWVAWIAAAGSALFMAMLIGAPAMLSSDAYAYSFYGRLLAVYGADAHAAAPAASTADPFLCNGWYEFVPSVYGPLWTVISAGIARAGGGHVGVTLLMFRILGALSALGCGGLIWLILRRISRDRALEGLLLFILNPLVVMESGLAGHHDSCMMVFALLAVWLHLRGWRTGAAVALMASALIKVVTVPLIPLYLLMLLREPREPSQPLRARIGLASRAGLAALAALILAMAAARMGPSAFLVHTAGSAAYYENNYHELIFKGLRRALGEPADSLDAPMDFETFWVQTWHPATLHAGTSNKSSDLAPLGTGKPLLVISNEDSDDWLRVYDPASRLQGYVAWEHLVVASAPPMAESDSTVRRLSGWPPEWPTVIKANRAVRVTTWLLFIAFGLAAAWYAADFPAFLKWATRFFIVSLLLVLTRIWPWYLVWPLAFGIISPGSWRLRLAICVSVGMTFLYAIFDFCDTRFHWAYDCRSVFTILLPIALCGAWRICSALSSAAAPDSPALATAPSHTA